MNNPLPNQTAEQQKPKKDRKLIIAYGIVGFIVLALVIIAIYNNTRPNKKNLQQVNIQSSSTTATTNEPEKLARYTGSDIPLVFSYPESLHIGTSTGAESTELAVGSRVIVFEMVTRNQAVEAGRQYASEMNSEGEPYPSLVSSLQYDADKKLIETSSWGEKVKCPDSKTIINASLSYSPLQCEIVIIDNVPALKRYYYPSPWDHDVALEYAVYIGDKRVDILSSPRAKDLNDYLQKEQANNDADFKLANQIIKSIVFPTTDHYFNQKVYDDGVTIKNGDPIAQYIYKDTVLSAERYEKGAGLFVTRNGKKSLLIPQVLTDCCGGGFTEFRKTKDPNIALLYGLTGDMGGMSDERNYVILSTEKSVKISYTNIPVIETTSLAGMNSTIALITDTSGCKGSEGKMFINGISVNSKLSYTFTKPAEVGCVDPSDGIYVPNFEFRIKGIDATLSKLYFTMPYYSDRQTASAPKIMDFIFDLESQNIETGTLSETLY